MAVNFIALEAMMNEIIKLSPREWRELEDLLPLALPWLAHQRARALLLLDAGAQVEAVAEQLEVSRQTIYNWAYRFTERRDRSVAERILDAPRSGRPATAQGLIDPLIDELMETDPRDYGYRATVWTAALLRHYLGEHHHQWVGRRSISYALDRLHLHWKHPRHVLARREPFWRQSKGGSNRASGPILARSC
jgi:transposase